MEIQILKNQLKKFKIATKKQKLLKKWKKPLRKTSVTSSGWPTNKIKYSKDLKQMTNL